MSQCVRVHFVIYILILQPTSELEELDVALAD
jgi:hypothetical protein